MPELSPGKPVTSRTPELLVENKFEAGRYRFELVVIDDSGLESAPTELVVSVQAAGRTKDTLVAKDTLVTKAEISERPVLRPTPTPPPEPVISPVKPVVSPAKPVVLQSVKTPVEPIATPIKPTVPRPVKPK